MRKLTANDDKFYLGYFNKLVDECNSTYHRCIDKKPVDTDFLALTEKIESSHKAPKNKLVTESKFLSIRIFLAKFTSKIGQKKYLRLNFC